MLLQLIYPKSSGFVGRYRLLDSMIEKLCSFSILKTLCKCKYLGLLLFLEGGLLSSSVEAWLEKIYSLVLLCSVNADIFLVEKLHLLLPNWKCFHLTSPVSLLFKVVLHLLVHSQPQKMFLPSLKCAFDHYLVSLY